MDAQTNTPTNKRTGVIKHNVGISYLTPPTSAFTYT